MKNKLKWISLRSRNVISCLLMCLVFQIGFSQNVTVTAVKRATLSDTLNESSGLVWIQGHLFSHNDSGNDPDFFEIDTATGKIMFTYHVANAQNIDWEDITADDSFLYIGDFGNNDGNRKDLCIYKLPMGPILNHQSTVYAQKISFSYSDQLDFSPKPYSTNYDMEAMTSVGKYLYLFSKNWGNFKSRVYRCPKDTGKCILNVLDSFNASGLITGASFSETDTIIHLCGYTFTTAFLGKVKFDFAQQKVTSFVSNELINQDGFQIEGIAHTSATEGFLSCEKNSKSAASLFKYNFKELISSYELNINDLNVKVYPNPFRQTFDIESPLPINYLEIYTLSGQLIFADYYNKLTSEFEKNMTENTVFILHLFPVENGKTIKKIILKN